MVAERGPMVGEGSLMSVHASESLLSMWVSDNTMGTLKIKRLLEISRDY